MRREQGWSTALVAMISLLVACEGTTPAPKAAPTGGGAGSSSASAKGGSSAILGPVGGSSGKSSSASSSAANDICSGKGPVVTIPATTTTSSYKTCTGKLAETHFVSALCTCENATVAGYLRTRAFNSKQGTSLDLGGSVGVNQTYAITEGFTDVGGSMSIAGPDSLSFAGYLKTGADLRTQGDAVVAGYTNVGRNMWVGHGFTDLGPVKVAGDLHMSGPIMAIPLSVTGAKTQEAVTIAPPCPCAPSDIINVASMVAEAKDHNDNAANGIRPDMFDILVGNIEATLPCGKFYINQIAGIGNVIFKVTGRAALFIDGSVANTGNLEFQLSPSAEIDIFIRENLVLTGRAIFGDESRPAASRIYVGGEGTVLLTGFGKFVGNLYAPRSLVQAVGYADVAGSIFAGNFLSPGYANFAFDAAISTAGDTCGDKPDKPSNPPPTGCTQCGVCSGGTACVNGTCGACHADADCCGQLICSSGKCVQPGQIIY